MKELSPDDRPREKLLRHGVTALGDNELVALVLGSGGRGRDALDLANALLGAHGGLHGLARATSSDMAETAGVGATKAAQVVAAFELGRRSLACAPAARLRLRLPRDTAHYLLPLFGVRPVEHFGIVLLDARHRVIRTVMVASGSLNSTVVEPRDVFREAMRGRAAAIVAFHNHPSGDPTPSPEDMALTHRLAAAGRLLGIDLVDHVVLGDARYFSFKEVGHL
jgi:DNA repair protein RadC